MAKPIAIATSDWHYHIYKKFNKDNSRTIVIENFIHSIMDKSRELGVPILFPGDMTHTPKGISTGLHERLNMLFKPYNDKLRFEGGPNIIIGISGNHEFEEPNYPDSRSASVFRANGIAFPNVIVEIDFMVYEAKNFTVCGIPYINRNRGLEEELDKMRVKIKNLKGPKILLMHSDAPSAIDTNGREVASHSRLPANLGEFFKGFDLVLFGHIHKFQKLWKNVYMVGAPMQQRKSDMGCEMGYLIIYDDLSVKFVKTDLPEFRTYNEGEEIPDDYHYYTMIPKAKKELNKVKKVFSNKANKTDLALSYFKATKVKSRRKKQMLIDVLNQIEDTE